MLRRLFFNNSGKMKLFLPFILLVVFSLLLLSADTPQKKVEPSFVQSTGSQAVVTVSFGEEHGTRSFSGEVFDGMTVADALTVAGRTGNFEVKFSDDGRPIAVNGSVGPWRIEHNGQPLDMSLFAITIAPGDTVMVRKF